MFDKHRNQKNGIYRITNGLLSHLVTTIELIWLFFCFFSENSQTLRQRRGKNEKDCCNDALVNYHEWMLYRTKSYTRSELTS